MEAARVRAARVGAMMAVGVRVRVVLAMEEAVTQAEGTALAAGAGATGLVTVGMV